MKTSHIYRKFTPSSRIASAIMACICIFAIFSISTTSADASQRVSVVALVNGEPITSLDLENRMKFLRTLSNLEMDGADFRADTLQKLVSEKIKFQAAKEQLGNFVPEATSTARQLVDQNFRKGDKPGGQVLKERGISVSTVTDKYLSDILWGNVLRVRFPRQFENLDNLAEQELKKLKAAQNEPQIKLSEILLQPNPNRPKDKTSELADKIIEALERKASFSSIASQYSEAATAQQGGRVNWMLLSRLPVSLQTLLLDADEGEVIGPIELDGRLYILKKDGFRENGLADPKAATLTMARAIQPLAADASKEDRSKAGEKILQETADLQNCNEMADLNKKLGSGALPILNDLQVGSLSPQLQKIMAPLQVGEKSPALPFSEGMTVFMVCERVQPTTELPDIETLKRVEFEKLFNSISGRYLLRLQRKAVIDYRS
ncbi:MAG: peptidylprolyl isomerase [Candidatus Puniceispirillaceae bacterium]